MAKVYDYPSKLTVNGGADAMLDTCKRRFFFAPSFEIYNGVAGLFDLGPPMTAIKNNALAIWRTHFIIEEGMVEIETTNMTPEDVFITSGHVERFNDVMTKDVKNGECFRLDKLVEDYCDKRLCDPKDKMDADTRAKLIDLQGKVDGMSPTEMEAEIKALGIKSPKGNDLAPPFAFNLMFSSSIGPDGAKKGYLRPELAQGIFMNFKRMLEFNNGKMPFAGATTGQAFRNEIAPRGLLRVREFQLAEIEHFCHPDNKQHPKFVRVRELEVPLLSREKQEANEPAVWMKLGDAVDNGIIDNETLGYFMGRVYMFLSALGARYVRFRQHRRKEMAHYAKDCWDAEMLHSGGWLECVGIADRSCYDLEVHTKKTGVDMSAYELYPEPRDEEQLERKVDKQLMGKTFKKEAGRVQKYLTETLVADGCLALEKELENIGKATVTIDGDAFELERSMASFKVITKKISGRNYCPSVIEPSFGIGRILYCILEQTYFVRAGDEPAEGKEEKKKGDIAKGEKRASFALPARIAPYKLVICPLMNKEAILPHVTELATAAADAGLPFKVDDTGVAIGRRYARTDELGTPFCITVDYTTGDDGTVTLRERDSCTQVRIPKTEVIDCISKLCVEKLSWSAVQAKYPEQAAAAAEKVGV